MTKGKFQITSLALILISASCFSQNSFDLTKLDSGQLLLNLDETEVVSVEQDILNASLSYSAQGSGKISLQNEVNKNIAAALEIIDSVSELEYSTGQYYIYTIQPGMPPQNGLGIPIWRAQQGLKLSSSNSSELLEIVGQLQAAGLEVNGLNYSLSDEASKKATESLLSMVLNRLERKASETANLLGKNFSSLIELTIRENGNGGFFEPRMEMMRDSQVGTQQFERPSAVPGRSEVSLSVSAKALLSP